MGTMLVPSTIPQAQARVFRSIYLFCYEGRLEFDYSKSAVNVPSEPAEAAWTFDWAAGNAPVGPASTLEVVPHWLLEAEFDNAKIDIAGAVRALVDRRLIKVVHTCIYFTNSWRLENGARLTVSFHTSTLCGHEILQVYCFLDGKPVQLVISELGASMPCYRLTAEGIAYAENDPASIPWHYEDELTKRVAWDPDRPGFIWLSDAIKRLSDLAGKFKTRAPWYRRIGELLDQKNNPIRHMRRAQGKGGARNRKVYESDVDLHAKYLLGLEVKRQRRSERS